MLILSILLICLAHYIRTLRWELFVKTYESPKRNSLLQALSIGYFINFFIPFKLGDLIKAFVVGRKMKNGKGFALATVIVDRYLDILVVGFCFLIFALVGISKNKESVFFYMLIASGTLILTVIVYTFRGRIKKNLKKIAAIFNCNIEFKFLKFCWALIWSFKDIFLRINKCKLIMTTISMWIIYLCSYFCFAKFLSNKGIAISFIDIFYILFEKDSIYIGSVELLSSSFGFSASLILWIGIYLLLPIIILFCLSSFTQNESAGEKSNESAYLNLIPHIDEEERLNFLETYFENDKRDYIDSYLKINQNILIINDYSAGSNATTMLCMDEGKNFFRKYAFGEDGEKLYQQIEWLQRFKEIIPLPDIVRYCKEDNFCFYDMPYNSNAVGLFNYAHSMPKEKAWLVIKNAVESLEESLYKTNLRRSDKDTIDKYISAKVDNNLAKIMKAKYIKGLLEYDDIIINGRIYKNLPYYLKYLSKKHLQEVFEEDMYSEIHGDLTIENIICSRDAGGKEDFYIIDPNTGNLHDSPNLDYGKLLQSIHGGYEFLMATKNVDVDKNRINFVFTKSESYTYLYNMLDAYMMEKFSLKKVKSIYYHEIVHWLRLMPYKIEKNGKRVLLFYAGMLMVMNDVIKKFEEE